jgi:hypothetical protein
VHGHDRASALIGKFTTTKGGATMASKAEQIIDHFTKDAKLKEQILQAIKESKGKSASVDQVLAKFHFDAATMAKAREIAKKIRAGHSHHAIAGYHHVDANKANRAAATMGRHQGAVVHILKSK